MSVMSLLYNIQNRCTIVAMMIHFGEHSKPGKDQLKSHGPLIYYAIRVYTYDIVTVIG